MNPIKSGGTLCALILIGLLAGCAGAPEDPAPEPVAAPSPDPQPPESAVGLPDPPPREGKLVHDFVRRWVSARVDGEHIYDIPERAGHDVQGVPYGYHTVHMKDEDTYHVCVEFKNADNLYDVDFLVDKTADGMAVADHFLHKVNGEPVM